MPKQEAQAQLSTAQARRLAIDHALLGPRSGLGRGSEAILALIDRLAYVQIDSIAVVNRAHHHTVWSRIPGYQNGGLYDLLRQRRIFEYWGHAASFMPMQDYRFFLPLMQRFRDSPGSYTARRTSETKHLFRPVLNRIERDGPLCSADFGNEHGGRRGTWWDWKPAKIVLELLLWRGALMVSERRGFQRYYDLSERVLPAGTDRSHPDDAEVARYIVERTLLAYGIASEKDMREMLRIARHVPVKQVLAEMTEKGEIAQVRLAEQPEQSWYMTSETLDRLPRMQQRRPKLHLLSPFDNLVIQRERLKSLFGFDYRIECYVPAQKRVFGYFSLPFMWNEQFAGRLDAKAHRKSGELEVRALHLEEGVAVDAEFCTALAQLLKRFAGFNDCSVVSLDCSGQNFRAVDRRRIRAALG